MASNQIISSKVVGSMARAGAQIILAGATRTPAKITPETVIDQISPGWIESVEADTRPLPADTAELVLRDGLHISPKDPVKHYSVVLLDKNKKRIGTWHYYPVQGLGDTEKTEGDTEKNEGGTSKGDV